MRRLAPSLARSVRLLAVGILAAVAAGAWGAASEPAVCRPLLFASEGARKIIEFTREGTVAWEYPAEMSRDVWRLPNGNTLFCYNNRYDSARGDNPSGVMEVSPDQRIVFHFQTTGQVWSCQRLANGQTMVGAASQGQLLIVDARGVLVRKIKLRNAPGHSCLRNARQLPNGNFLVAEESAHAVREYSPEGQVLREFNVPFPPYSAVRLANGHTLICGGKSMVEVTPDGQNRWSLLDSQIPQMGLRWFAGLQVLSNGHVVVCNAGGQVPFFEVNRERQIVWRWPAAGVAAPIGHGLQCLDEAGPPLK